MFGALDIPTSGLVAQRQRMTTIASNMTMMNTPVDPSEENPDQYRRRIPVFSAGNPGKNSPFGVHLKSIMLDQAPFRKAHEPGHPFADKDGYVRYPNIHPAVEQMNMLEASRAYEANITVAEATKSMMNAAIRLLA